MSFADKTLTCRDCGNQFVFTAGEQEFYQSRGLLNEPGRCPDCRATRRSSRSQGGYSSGGGGYSSGGSSYDRPRREMYPAVCSSCGQDTQVPFQPRGDKPVYCSDCFANVRGSSGGGSYR
ncbi:MAG TPA: zinc-ribbon domain containing protein [Chloroflexota bacterium]|nr:zinc-ribbon domain containing protein [Chloroflexota bacterium]